MMIRDIAEYLSGGVAGDLGDGIFLYAMPDKPRECVALCEYAGLAPEQAAAICMPGLQVIARGKKAISKLEYIHQKLCEIGFEWGKVPTGVEINGCKYFRCVPTASGVTSLGEDGRGERVFVRNYYIYMEEM